MVRTGSDGQLGTLLEALAQALAGDAACAVFADALATIEPGSAAPLGAGAALPVLGWWDEALSQPGPASTRAIAACLGALRASLTFVQNPNYVALPPSPAFLGRYGYAVLTGPRSGPPALTEHPGLALGVLLLGPDTVYPPHVHPARELYLPLGRARWRTGSRPLRERPAGTPLVHAPHEPHETRTGGTPLAALYVWLGDLETAAHILAPGSTRP